MKEDALDQQLRDGLSELDEHWSFCLEEELTGHTAALHKQVNDSLAQYFQNLKAVADDNSKNVILSSIKQLFQSLDEVNRSSGGGLLETDEREIIVPLVVEAAELCGLDVGDFEDEDPTYEFRTF